MTWTNHTPVFDISTPTFPKLARRTNEMDAPPGVHLADLLLQHLGAFDGRTCRGHACDEHLCAVGFEGVFDTSPVGYLEWGDRETDCDCVETEEAVAEDDWVLRA